MKTSCSWRYPAIRRHAGQNIDLLTQREQQQIETLSRNSQKIRTALADFKPRLNRKGEELQANLTDPESAVMKTSHGVVQGYTGVALFPLLLIPSFNRRKGVGDMFVWAQGGVGVVHFAVRSDDERGTVGVVQQWEFGFVGLGDF